MPRRGSSRGRDENANCGPEAGQGDSRELNCPPEPRLCAAELASNVTPLQWSMQGPALVGSAREMWKWQTIRTKLYAGDKVSEGFSEDSCTRTICQQKNYFG